MAAPPFLSVSGAATFGYIIADSGLAVKKIQASIDPETGF